MGGPEKYQKDQRRAGLAGVIRGSDLLQVGLHSPDLLGILGDGTVTGELPRASDVVDHLLGPLFRVLSGWRKRVNNSEVQTRQTKISMLRRGNDLDTDLVECTDFILGTDVLFIVSKHLKPAMQTPMCQKKGVWVCVSK